MVLSGSQLVQQRMLIVKRLRAHFSYCMGPSNAGTVLPNAIIRCVGWQRNIALSTYNFNVYS